MINGNKLTKEEFEKGSITLFSSDFMRFVCFRCKKEVKKGFSDKNGFFFCSKKCAKKYYKNSSNNKPCPIVEESLSQIGKAMRDNELNNKDIEWEDCKMSIIQIKQEETDDK